MLRGPRTPDAAQMPIERSEQPGTLGSIFLPSGLALVPLTQTPPSRCYGGLLEQAERHQGEFSRAG